MIVDGDKHHFAAVRLLRVFWFRKHIVGIFLFICLLAFEAHHHFYQRCPLVFSQQTYKVVASVPDIHLPFACNQKTRQRTGSHHLPMISHVSLWSIVVHHFDNHDSQSMLRWSVLRRWLIPSHMTLLGILLAGHTAKLWIFI